MVPECGDTVHLYGMQLASGQPVGKQERILPAIMQKQSCRSNRAGAANSLQ